MWFNVCDGQAARIKMRAEELLQNNKDLLEEVEQQRNSSRSKLQEGNSLQQVSVTLTSVWSLQQDKMAGVAVKLREINWQVFLQSSDKNNRVSVCVK